MTTVTRSVVVNAPRSALAPIMNQAEYVPRTATNIYRWEQGPGWPAPGTQTKVGFKAAGMDVDGIATSQEYDPETLNRVFIIETDNGNPPSTWRYTFDEQDGQTTVTAHVEYTVPGSYLGKVVDKLFVERASAKQLEESLANIKAFAEGQQ